MLGRNVVRIFRCPRCSCGSKLITLFRSQSPARVCKNRANKNMTSGFTTTCIAVYCMGIKTEAKHPSKQLPVQIQAYAKKLYNNDQHAAAPCT